MDIIVACTIIRLDFISPHVLHTQHDSMCTKSGWENGANSFLQIETRIPNLACACPLPRRGARVRAYRVDSAVLCSTHLHQRRHLFRNDSKKRQHTSCFCCLEWFSNSIFLFLSCYLRLNSQSAFIHSSFSTPSAVQIWIDTASVKRQNIYEKLPITMEISVTQTKVFTRKFVCFFVKPWREKN